MTEIPSNNNVSSEIISFNIEPETTTLEKLADIGNAELHDTEQGKIEISNAKSLSQAGDKSISFLSNSKYIDEFKNTKAAACVIKEEHIKIAPNNTALIIAKDPYLAYALITNFLYKNKIEKGYISHQSSIDSSAKIGKECVIEPFVTIKSNAVIGDGTIIRSGSYIDEKVVIGKNCTINHCVTISHAILSDEIIIHAGVRIGQDGFGYATNRQTLEHIKVQQLGRVIIKDKVEIGANSCIDRGASPDTIIGEGTKIDNLVQIGHNVQMGKGCILVSQSGVAGSTQLGNYVVIGGQAGVAGHLKIEDGVNIAGQSGVMNNISAGNTVGGYPSQPIRDWHKQNATLRKIIKNKNKGN